MTLIDNLYESWRDLLDNKSDPRVKDWPLMQSPLPTIGIVAVYILFVLKIGPQWMKHRKPFELKKTIILYNFLQVALSCYLFYNASVNGWLTTFNWRCEALNRSTTGQPMAVSLSLF
jgi:elongation of very long chain fatty acids protein 7